MINPEPKYDSIRTRTSHLSLSRLSRWSTQSQIHDSMRTWASQLKISQQTRNRNSFQEFLDDQSKYDSIRTRTSHLKVQQQPLSGVYSLNVHVWTFSEHSCMNVQWTFTDERSMNIHRWTFNEHSLMNVQWTFTDERSMNIHIWTFNEFQFLPIFSTSRDTLERMHRAIQPAYCIEN